MAWVSGRAMTSTSAAASTWSRSASVPMNSTGSLVRPEVFTAWMRAPNARIRPAVAWPMPPKPRIAHTAPSRVSTRSHILNSPRMRSACRCGSRRARASVTAMTYSAIGLA